MAALRPSSNILRGGHDARRAIDYVSPAAASRDVETALQQWQAAIAIDKQAAEPQMAMAVALYAKGDRKQSIAMGEAALRIDNRHADLEYLKQNLWGDRLLADTQKFLIIPRIQATVQKLQSQPASPQGTPQQRP